MLAWQCYLISNQDIREMLAMLSTPDKDIGEMLAMLSTVNIKQGHIGKMLAMLSTADKGICELANNTLWDLEENAILLLFFIDLFSL